MKAWERQRARREVIERAHAAIDELARQPDDPDELADAKEDLSLSKAENERLRADNEKLKAENKRFACSPEARSFERLGQELQFAVDENRKMAERIASLESELRLVDQKDLSRMIVSNCNGMVERGGFYVYQLLSEKGQVVYVGKSASLMHRMQGHRDKEWTHVKFEQHKNNRRMEERESELIHAMHPQYNKNCPVCGLINVPDPEQATAA